MMISPVRGNVGDEANASFGVLSLLSLLGPETLNLDARVAGCLGQVFGGTEMLGMGSI